MTYVISTEIDGTIYCIKTNMEKKCFELTPVKTQQDLGRVFSPPHNTNAHSILKWINENDPALASKNLEVQPAARYQR